MASEKTGQPNKDVKHEVKQRTSGSGEQQVVYKKTSPVLIAIIIVLLIALLAVVAVLVYKSRQPVVPETTSKHLHGNVDIKDDPNGSAVATRVAEGMIVVKMKSTWVFPDGKSEGNGYVANSEANGKPMFVTVQDVDTGDTLLEAGPIPVGSCIENFKLDKELEAGTYTAIVAHSLLDENDEVYNTVRTQVTIEVKN